jgi:DNA-binding NarL/FixJ family response regulator
MSELEGPGAAWTQEPSGRAGRGAAWTEERGTSDEGRRGLQAPRPAASQQGTSDEGRRRLQGARKLAGIRVLIADDHPVVRQGLQVLLSVQDDIAVVGAAADGAQAVALCAELTPDVLLLDLKLPVLDGVAVLRELRDRGEAVGRIRSLVLTSAADQALVALALQAGAAGFLYKDVDPDALIRAVRSVHDGHTVLAPAAAGLLTTGPGRAGAAVTGIGALTSREREVLALLAEGGSNREIARQLGVAEKTVKTHVSSILAKLGAADRTQAAVIAVRHAAR